MYKSIIDENMHKLINMFRYVENVLFMSGLYCKKNDFVNKTKITGVNLTRKIGLLFQFIFSLLVFSEWTFLFTFFLQRS